MNMTEIENRKAPEVFSKYKEAAEKNHLSARNKEKPKLDYKYYCCDYCHNEIKIDSKWENRTGGVLEIPLSMWPRGRLKMALHNGCYKAAMKEIEREGGKLK